MGTFSRFLACLLITGSNPFAWVTDIRVEEGGQRGVMHIRYNLEDDAHIRAEARVGEAGWEELDNASGHIGPGVGGGADRLIVWEPQWTPLLYENVQVRILADLNRMANVPGVVLAHESAPASFSFFGNIIVTGRPRIYTTSPSIAVLPNGDYLITDNIFGAESGADESGTTRVYRSSDQGLTWEHLTTLSEMKRGSLFVRGDAVYLYGYPADPGSITMRRSTDNGATWTTATDGSDGIIRSGNQGGTPQNLVVHDGRIWAAQGVRFMSAPVDADLLLSSSWTLSLPADTGQGPFAPTTFGAEPQVVASPHTGVVGMPLVTLSRNYGVLVQSAGPPREVIDPGEDEWVSIPGAEKKFGAAYDPVSGRFWLLSNPVLAAHFGETTNRLARNTAALISSVDLRHWDVEQIFLYSPNLAYEAFQYLNFDFDGDDMVIASRTAFDVGGNRPPRGHDSNLITFHRITDFRAARPNHFLEISGGRVLRREQTQHAAAPLGDFALGSSFASSPLSSPVGIGQAESGDVYIAEQGGRILRFDELGNFIAAVPEAPFSLDSGSLPLQPPSRLLRNWTRNGSGSWFDLDNWFYWNRPDTAAEIAVFGSGINAASSVSLDRAWRVRGVRLRSDHSYSLVGEGSLVLNGDDGEATLEGFRGTHYFNVNVDAESDLVADAEGQASLVFEGEVSLNGHTLFLRGPGELVIAGDWSLGGGSVVVTGENQLRIATEGSLAADGILEFRPEDWQPSAGTVFQLMTLEDGGMLGVHSLVLPELDPDLTWDTSSFEQDGSVSITALARVPQLRAKFG